MQFHYPVFLIVGLGVCLGLGWLYHRLQRSRRASLEKFAAPHLVERLTASVSPGRRLVKFVLLLVGVACLFVALARPQVGFRWEEAHRRGIDILMAVDTSKSMMANDVQPSRLERARLGILDFVSKLEGDRVGLIPFAGTAFLMCPLTLDYDAFRQSLNALDTTLMPRGGTDIASAIREAEAAFDKDANHRMLVLITDGEDLEGEALAAASAAAKRGMIIHTIGVGTPAGELIPMHAPGGGTTFMKDEQGQVVKSRLDEGMLRKIADVTGGAYEPLGTQAEGLEAVYRKKLSLVPKTEFARRMHKVPVERFEWPLLLALILLALEYGLGDRKRMPRFTRASVISAGRRVVRPRQAAGAAASAVLLFAAMVPQASASPQDAGKAYARGEYETAVEQYQEALTENPGDATLQFNTGAAAYKSGAFDAAAGMFDASLESEDLGLQHQAYYNLGNTLFRQGEQTEQSAPQQTIQQWQEALKAYEGAMALNAGDEDAQFNHDLVARRLEELQKQQEQQDPQQCNNPENSENPSQGGGSDAASDGDQEKNQQDVGNQARDSGEDRDKAETAEREASGQGSRQEQQQPGPTAEGDEASKGRTDLAQGQPEPAQPDQESRSTGMSARREPGRMSPEEAANLLDSLKGEESEAPFLPASAGVGGREDDDSRRDW